MRQNRQPELITGGLRAMTVAMVLYLIMTFVFSRLLRFWESKLDGPASFDLATTDQLAHTSGNYSYPGEGSI